MGITVLLLDVVDPSSIAEAVKSVEAAAGGTLDFLVNNFGIGELNSSLNYSQKRIHITENGYAN
jgi:NAD(P)-dependent dehydrogenase (short-subunit alcohol dehydrogenase family)